MSKPDLPSTNPAPQDEHPASVADDAGISSALASAGQAPDAEIGINPEADLGINADAGIDAQAVAAMQGVGNPEVSVDLAGDLGLSSDSDLMAALHGLDVGNIDHALDQLTSSVDLFDLPVLDAGDTGHADS